MIRQKILFGFVLLFLSSSLFANWKYSEVTDQMTDEIVYFAKTSSINTLNFGFPYSGAQKGSLTIRVHPRHGLDMIISIEQGQILCQSYEDCSVLIRLGSNKPKNQNAAGSADNSRNFIFLRNPEYILPNLSSSKKLLLELPIYQEGNVLLEFKTANLDVNKLGGLGQSSAPSSKKPSPNQSTARVVFDRYAEIMKQKVIRNWNKPANTTSDMQATLKVILIPGGDVRSVEIIRSSGNAIFDRSAESAVYLAAPFDMPENPREAAAMRDITIIFKPE